MTNRTNRFWSQQDDFTASYVNGRNQDPSWQYDEDGRVLKDTDVQYSWDAAGSNRQVQSLSNTRLTTQEQDGEGQVVRRTEGYQGLQPYTDSYYLRSSVLGGRVITEISQSGQKLKGYIYAGSDVLARQENNYVSWQHTDPLTGNQGESFTGGSYVQSVEADPMGINVGAQDPFIDPLPNGFEANPEQPMLGGMSGSGCNGSNPLCTRCYLDGFEMDCAQSMFLLDAGLAGFQSTATVRVTYSNGRAPQTFTGQTTLPGGLDIRFTRKGQAARAAAIGFNVGAILGGFNGGVYGAINSGFAAVANGVDGTHAYGGFAFSFLPQQTAPLSSTGQQIFDNARNNLLKELKGMDDASKCAKFLSIIGGIGAVAASIRAMQPYDGRESNITYKEAGVIDYGNSEVQGLSTSARAEIENKLVSAFFQNGLYFGGAMSGSNNRVFFGPFPIKNTEGYVAATILHESLHTLTGYGDERLATLLFGKKFTNNENASAAISKGLKDNGCVKRR